MSPKPLAAQAAGRVGFCGDHKGKRAGETRPLGLNFTLPFDLDKKWLSRLGSRYWRVVAEVEDLIDLAAQFKQRTLYGIGFARNLIRI